tara:strand:- start:1081 stop:1260 length:180 start_codon:yes stop_codon:yes gene_type:complete
MIKIENFTTRFQVVAIHRQTGKVQFASIYAPTQVDADDFVADFQPNWIVIRDNKDLSHD